MSESERRKFSRILYQATAHLVAGEQHWSTNLLDLSLKGALVETPTDWPSEAPSSLQLQFKLGDSDIELNLAVAMCHQHKDHLGLKNISTDIETASHLKRLVQLNIGDESLLNREIDELTHHNQS
ncbi:PilZ domain-containing protein [Motilimonas pumila]|uniref:Cyclic diguanosine monophosphate-binding protein n=1 Tax=Motilimonas pumila TaxID=2303987 RepID=A0A418YK11_9GAMM|nr:PilZ domain-containing protein [Motilimonas pumila]RJG51322.1 PilZ domain-containing protein [Motilimonas pumila]